MNTIPSTGPHDPSLRALGMLHYEELARIGKALASPIRLQLIDLLRQGPRTVELLAERAGATVANVSQHLQQLRAARLVHVEKVGQHVTYRLANDDVGLLFSSLRALAESVLPEFDRVRAALRTHDAAARAALLDRIGEGRVTLLDVRPEEEWRAGHLPGAIHIPLDALATRLHELPKKKEVVAYCRGPYCPMALAAVAVLEGAGFRAAHLDLGPPDLAHASRAPSPARKPASKTSAKKKRSPT